MRPSNSTIANGISCSNSFTSSVCWATDIIRCSYAAVVSSGSLNGTFTLQGSNDKPTGAFPIQFQPTNWYSVASASTVFGSSSATSLVFAIPSTEVCAEYLRVTFTLGGPANGLVSINFVAKGL